MPRGPLIHRAPAPGIVLRHVRGNVHPAEFSYEFLRVVVPIPSQRHSLSRRNGFRHEQRGTPFRYSIRLGQKTSALKARCDFPSIHVPGSPASPRYLWTS